MRSLLHLLVHFGDSDGSTTAVLSGPTAGRRRPLRGFLSPQLPLSPCRCPPGASWPFNAQPRSGRYPKAGRGAGPARRPRGLPQSGEEAAAAHPHPPPGESPATLLNIPQLRAAMGVGEAVRLRVGEEGLEEGMQWGYNLGWKGDALRMQLGMQLGWNRNGMGLHLGAQLGWGGWNRDALGIELGVHQENTGDATGMQWGWNRDDWNATKISYR